MVKNGDVIILSKKEALELVEKECRGRLGISLREFRQKSKHRELPRSVAVHDIEALLRFA